MWYQLLFLHLVWFIAVASQNACFAQNSKPVSVDSQNSSMKNSDIRKNWTERTKDIDRKTKNYPREYLNIMLEILKQSPAEQAKAELEEVVSNPNDYSALPEYERVLLQANVSLLIDNKRDGELTELLAKKVPRRIASIPLELYLSIKHSDKLLVLFNSYEKAQDASARKMLLEILSSVFPDFRTKTKTDEDFVSMSRKWYSDNQNLEVNPFYSPNSSWASQRVFFKQN